MLNACTCPPLTRLTPRPPGAAPVATRLVTYDVPLPVDLPHATAYVATILRHSAVRRWYADAASSHTIEHYDEAARAYGAPRAPGVGVYDASLTA